MRKIKLEKIVENLLGTVPFVYKFRSFILKFSAFLKLLKNLGNFCFSEQIFYRKNSRWVPLTGSHVKNGQLNGLKALFTWRKVASGSKSDQHQFSPNNISRSSRVKVMRITELITSERIL